MNFRIDWGYQYLYSRRTYHPTLVWDGKLDCENGKIDKIFRLDYPVCWFGPIYTPNETLIKGNSWQNKTKRGVSGIRVEADACDDTVFHLKTETANVSFTAKELIENGRLTFSVGPKYLGCRIMVTLDGYLWFRTPLKENETAFEIGDFNLPIKTWQRTRVALVKACESAKWEYEVKESPKDVTQTVMHTVIMAIPNNSGWEKESVHQYVPTELYCDGKCILKYERYYRTHDLEVQLLEDDFKSIEVPAGKHVFELKNCSKDVSLGITRIVMRQNEYSHGDLFVPEWCLKNEEIICSVFSVKNDEIKVKTENKDIFVSCKRGWNEFKIAPKCAGSVKVYTDTDEKYIECFDVEEEENPIKVGLDLTVVPHDSNGFMDHVLDYTYKTRMGNYIMFRNFTHYDTKPEELYRWGSYCKQHGMYISDCRHYDKALFESAGEFVHEAGPHEFSGRVYAADPKNPPLANDMKEAQEAYIAHLRKGVEDLKKYNIRTGIGDASGAARYVYMAGFDYIRAETMVPNTMPLLSKVRPASEALSDGTWGVHIAIQHFFQPYHMTHLNQFFLCLMQPWMMGAELIYEEDSMFGVWKEERQAWDDVLARGKRDLMRSFFKFAKTHPREGKNKRNIGFIEGRYAAPFNGFICGPEQDPHYSVWGLYGQNSEEWGHKQPEKCRHILDVLMPGASVAPLRQQYDKRRFFFAGTPYGDFDHIPTEANADFFSNYKLLASLGWNTMIDEDYDKLKSYVQNGGVLYTSLLQFSTHLKRDFLKDMEDIALYKNGDLTDLCGLKVLSKGKAYSGKWTCEGKENMEIPSLSSAPNDFEFEDGEAYLADILLDGAEVVSWDSDTGAPMLVKNKLGKGYIYTITAWAYPGHEMLQEFSATWLNLLAAQNVGDIYVVDSSKEVFWTRYECDNKTIIMLLNTDWTQPGNTKDIILVYPNGEYKTEIKESTAVKLTVENGKVSEEVFTL